MSSTPEKQYGRKTRSRTGCLTCRQRRLKCDEGKPTCQRCHKANLVCQGYEAPRHVPPKAVREATGSNTTAEHVHSSSPEEHEKPRHIPPEPILSEYDRLLEYQARDFRAQKYKVHPRASLLLAHSHYHSRTSKLLFNHSHLWFWRDRIILAAYFSEGAFDAITALGAIHILTLLLNRQTNNESMQGIRTVATESYESATRAINADGAQERASSDVRVAAQLLLLYYQCFDNNAAEAFRHLKAAKQTFLLHERAIQEKQADAPLRTCIRRFDLIAKAMLPQLIHGLDPAVAVLDKQYQPPMPGLSPTQDKEALMGLLAWDDYIHVAVWKPFNGHALEKASDILQDFHNELLEWRAEATNTFEYYDQTLLNSCYAETKPDVLDQLVTSPPPQRLRSNDAAMAAALYHSYMARVMSMHSASQQDGNTCEVLAQVHAYEVLRIAQGLVDDEAPRDSSEGAYVPGESINVSLASLLFLTSQSCYTSVWQEWIVAKLQALGHEGLHDGRAYAICLQGLKMVQQQHDPVNACCEETEIYQSCSPLGHVANRIIPLLFSNTDRPTFVAYYVQGDLPRTGQRTIRGRAAWTMSSDGNAQNLSLQFFDRESPINIELGYGCAYEFLAAKEPMALEWQHMLTSWDVL